MSLNLLNRLTLVSLLLLLAACRTPEPPQPTIVEPPPEDAAGFGLPDGPYACESDIRLELVRSTHPDGPLQIGWEGRLHTLARDPSSSGLPRFETEDNALVWIELPWKGVLLDGKTHKPIASECKPDES